MFKATVFMSMRCEDVEYCLKTARPREFFFEPQLDSEVVLEKGIGSAVVINGVKQSVIPIEQDEFSRQGVVVSVECLNDSTELIVNRLVESGGWKFVIDSSFVLDENDRVNEQGTERLRKRLREQKNARDTYSNRRR